MWGIESQFDVVRATFTDGTNVPRIPPVRVGGGLFWRDANWLARVNLLHAFAQNNVADDRRDADGGLQSAESRDQLQDRARSALRSARAN